MATANKTISKNSSVKSKVRIRLKSFDFRQLDAVTKQIVEILNESGAILKGPIPLPTRIRRYCVNSATHVDKRSGEHFEIRLHTRILEIIDPAEDTMGILQKVDLPAGVDVNIQVLEREAA